MSSETKRSAGLDAFHPIDHYMVIALRQRHHLSAFKHERAAVAIVLDGDEWLLCKQQGDLSLEPVVPSFRWSWHISKVEAAKLTECAIVKNLVSPCRVAAPKVDH